MNLDRFHNPNLQIPTAIACGLGIAIGLGLAAGGGEFQRVGMTLFGLAVAIYVLFFQHLTWKVAVFFCFLQFFHIGFGFTMTELEITLGLAALLFATTWWQKGLMEKPPVLNHWSFGWLNTITIMWLIYVLGHTAYNIYSPYNPQDFGLKNLLKTAVMWSGPLFLTLYFAIRPRGINIRRNFPTIIAWLLLLALVINIIIRLYHLIKGDYDEESDPNDPTSGDVQYIAIPGIGLVESTYALRGLSPLAMIFAGGYFTTRWLHQQSRPTQRLFHVIIAFSILGAAISGGRATLAATFILLMVILLVRRQIGLLMACFGGAVILVAAANAAPDMVKRSPGTIRRSLNWALIQKDVSASESISGSTDWRLNLFRKAIDEWHSSSRIFWFGRATYAFGTADYIATLIKGEEGKMESALRRGATHNLITDLLIVFGLVGLILYFSLVLSFLFLLWTIFRSNSVSEPIRMLALILFTHLAYAFGIGVFGGTNFPTAVAWLYVVLIGALYCEHRDSLAASSPPKIAPRSSSKSDRPARAPHPSLHGRL